jgi:LPXTG-motif cell wall-anchored protein
MFTGVKYTVDISKPAGQRIGNLTKMDGTVINDDTKLTLSVNNYRSNSQLTTYGPVYSKANGDTLPKLIAKSEDKWGDDGRVRDLIRQYIVDVKKGTITPEYDNNWSIIGNNWDAAKRAAVVAAVADGKLIVKPSEDGKSQNAISFTWNDIVKLAAPVTSVKLDQASLELQEGKTVQLKASVLPLYALDQNISWSSSDESIATVKDGLVTAIKAGKVTIIAKAGTIKTECTVEVKAVSVPTDNNNGNNGGTNNTTDTTKPVQVTNDTTKVVDAIKIAAEKSTVVVDATSNPVASKDIFTAIKGKDVNVTFQKDGIAWTFNGKDIDPSLIKDIDLSLKTVSADLKGKEAAKVKAIVGKDVAIVPFSFTYDGKLPGKATVKVFIGKDWANRTVYVNRYYADKNTYEMISEATVDADGYMTFTTDHCSDYFVMDKSAAPNLPKTGSPIDMNVVVGMGSLVALLGAALFISGRKREENDIAA